MHKLVAAIFCTLLVSLLIALVIPAQVARADNPIGQVVQCRPFQQTAVVAIGGDDVVFRGSIRIAARTSVTIEQIALRIDSFNLVAPTAATVTTSVGVVTSAWYLPIPLDMWSVNTVRPLTLMQPARIYADGGSDVRLTIELDSQYATGTGRAEWSVSGQSCTA
jgi:hypothetical protein